MTINKQKKWNSGCVLENFKLHGHFFKNNFVFNKEKPIDFKGAKIFFQEIFLMRKGTP